MMPTIQTMKQNLANDTDGYGGGRIRLSKCEKTSKGICCTIKWLEH